jgi:hypothetical protein
MKKILVLWLLMSGMFAHAQVQVKTFTDKESILIGERFNMTLESFMPLDQRFTWPTIDTLPHFEILVRSKIDTVENFNGRKITQSFQLTSFDSGHYTIPSISFLIGNTRYVTDTVGMDIGYAPMEPNADYKEIKDILDVEATTNPMLYYVIAGVVLLAALLAWYFSRKKKPVAAAAPVKPVSPYEEAMNALERVRKEGFVHNGSVKKYYSELNDILRKYLDAQLSLHSMEKTNEEIIRELRSLELSNEDSQQLSEALRVSDYVKFAKYHPDETLNEQSFQVIKNAIQSLNKSRN